LIYKETRKNMAMNTLNLPNLTQPLRTSMLCLAMAMALAALTPAQAQAQSRYAYSADGAEVTDAQTGLIWRRCTAGQTWSNGACAGGLTVFRHEEALAHAMTQTGWRLPNVKELASLVETSSVRPAINSVAFPGTPSTAYWSSTPDVQQPSSAWSIEFGMGAVAPLGRSTFGVLARLVR
jgi:hypothetical protein